MTVSLSGVHITDDLVATFDTIVVTPGFGVQQQPISRPSGVDIAVWDPAGNPVRIQPRRSSPGSDHLMEA